MSHNHNKVSIITACFKSAQVIEETILSVINQTYKNIEHIVIDAGSTDGTVDIIKKYSDNIGYWVSEPDNGISDAWNKGLMQCTGDIVGILNADDTYTPDAVRSALQVFSEHPEMGFVFGNVQMCDPEGVPGYVQKGDPNYFQCIKYDMPSIPHPTVFVRKEIYDKLGGFDTTFRTAMDYEFLRRISVNNIKGKYIPSILAKMRLGGESDRNFVRGYREVMKASIKYGYGQRKAFIRFYYKSVKTTCRRTLQNIGLDIVVRLFREFIGKRYKY